MPGAIEAAPRKAACNEGMQGVSFSLAMDRTPGAGLASPQSLSSAVDFRLS